MTAWHLRDTSASETHFYGIIFYTHDITVEAALLPQYVSQKLTTQIESNNKALVQFWSWLNA